MYFLKAVNVKKLSRGAIHWRPSGEQISAYKRNEWRPYQNPQLELWTPEISNLVGHSFGGLVALEVARNNTAFAKLAVYEPGVSISGSIPMDWMPRYEKKLARKEYLDAFVEFSIGTGPERARKTPHWLMKFLLTLFISPHERQHMFKLLHENLREHREVARLDTSYTNYREIPAGVLLMSSGKSTLPYVKLAMERLADVLPLSETKEFPGLDHFGIDKKAPQEVAKAVSEYFLK